MNIVCVTYYTMSVCILGDITIPDEVILSINTLTCISTGGPATTVTWTRDSVTITEGTETLLNDPETAQYTHTLTITSGGEYTCTVANDKPSTASATITVSGMYVLSLRNTFLSHKCTCKSQPGIWGSLLGLRGRVVRICVRG